MWECGIGIDDIIGDKITYVYLYFASMAGMDDIKYDDQPYKDLNPDVCENVVLGLLI